MRLIFPVLFNKGLETSRCVRVLKKRFQVLTEVGVLKWGQRFDNVLKLGERKSKFIILNSALTNPAHCLSGNLNTCLISCIVIIAISLNHNGDLQSSTGAITSGDSQIVISPLIFIFLL